MRDTIEVILKKLTKVCDYYERTAPTVHGWANDLFSRIETDADKVALSELLMVERLCENGEWQKPNYAANNVYKLQHRLGQETAGHVGF